MLTSLSPQLPLWKKNSLVRGSIRLEELQFVIGVQSTRDVHSPQDGGVAGVAVPEDVRHAVQTGRRVHDGPVLQRHLHLAAVRRVAVRVCAQKLRAGHLARITPMTSLAFQGNFLTDLTSC